MDVILVCMSFHIITYNEENLLLLDTSSSAWPHAQFLQSSAWARFQKQRGARVALLARSHEKNKTIEVYLMIRHSLPLGFSYWYIPRAPLVDSDDTLQRVVKEIGMAIRSFDPKAIFIRFEPIGEITGHDFIKTHDVQPSLTLLLSLKNSEEKILAEMHQKTRYNIRLAEKKSLTFKIDPSDVEIFLNLLEETKTRDNFRTHQREYYRTLIKSGAVTLASVWHNTTMLAGSLIAYHGDTATYVHGASASEFRDVMAPYLLHWEIIKRSRAAGYAWYDWQGIDEKKWPGVTRFKKGFGGLVVHFSGTYDAPLAPLVYRGYTVFRRLRRLFSFYG